jgi:hypothetical protein
VYGGLPLLYVLYGIDACHDFIIDIYWRIISQQFIAGVAKPGQRREIRRIVRHDAQMLGYLTGLPHPLGVRGFKSHLPHHRTFFQNALLTYVV